MNFDPHFYIDKEIMNQVCYKGLGLLNHEITIIISLDNLKIDEYAQIKKFISEWFELIFNFVQIGSKKDYVKNFTLIQNVFISEYSCHLSSIYIKLRYDTFNIHECETLFRLRENV